MKDFREIFTEWYANKHNVSPASPIGACRVYVSVHFQKGDRLGKRRLKEACKSFGLVFQDLSYYGSKNAIYVGYDNFDGKALALGMDLANRLKSAGYTAYFDYHAD